jgi:hypothetical protein
LISEIVTTGHAAGTVGVMTTGFVGVGGGEGASVFVHANTNRTLEIKITLFMYISINQYL